MANRIAGTMFFTINGEQKRAKGEYTYNPGYPRRNPILGSGGEVDGYTEEAQPARIEGVITDAGTEDIAALCQLDGGKVTLELANGKVVSMSDAWFAGEGDVRTGESEFGVMFHGRKLVET